MSLSDVADLSMSLSNVAEPINGDAEQVDSDLEIQLVDLTYSIGIKTEAEGKTRLAATDLELVSGLHNSSETSNGVRIVFNR